MRGIAWMLLLASVTILYGCAGRSAGPRWPGSSAGTLEVRDGIASYYGDGDGFHGKVSASGARFDRNAMVAAHPSYPFGTIVRVTNLSNGRAAEVRIIDRGPAPGPQAAGVVIDLSYRAARTLDFIHDGLTRVRLEVLHWGG